MLVNWADMFTKALDRKPFLTFRRVVMNVVDTVISWAFHVIEASIGPIA